MSKAWFIFESVFAIFLSLLWFVDYLYVTLATEIANGQFVLAVIRVVFLPVVIYLIAHSLEAKT